MASSSSLLAATTCLGIGFGLTVPSLNKFAAAFFPTEVERAVLSLNALLGLGTALAPVFVAIFVGSGHLVGNAARRRRARRGAVRRQPRAAAPCRHAELRCTAFEVGSRFGMFAAFALLYGVVETLNGNWAILYLSHTLGSSAALASLALTLFWAAATGGRILFAAIERTLPARTTFRLLPLLLAAAFVGIALLPHAPGALGPLAFALTGFWLLGAAAAHDQPRSPRRIGRPAHRLLSDGIRARGVRRRSSRGARRPAPIFGGGAVVALALAGLAVAIVHRSSARGAPTPSGRAAAVPG